MMEKITIIIEGKEVECGIGKSILEKIRKDEHGALYIVMISEELK